MEISGVDLGHRRDCGGHHIEVPGQGALVLVRTIISGSRSCLIVTELEVAVSQDKKVG